MLQLIQSETLKGLAGSHKKAVINGIQGEKQFRGADSNAPAALTLCWRKGKTTFLLFGTLTESLDEEEMYKIASSIK